MSFDDDPIVRRISALKEELAAIRPPDAVGRAVAAAIARAERGKSFADSPWKALREHWLAGPLAIAATLAVVAWTLRTHPGEPPQPDAPARAATDFIPIVPVAEIARVDGAYVVSAPMPRTMLADFGLPMSPARAAEPVRSELLVRGDGTVLAVRFLE